MILAVRTDSDTAELYLLDATGQPLKSQIWTAGRNLSEDLLRRIRDLLKYGKTEFRDLTGVVVYQGPGSFTGLRIGVAVANALAYGQQIPVAGSSGKNWIKNGLVRLKTTRTNQYVVPEYGKEPNITKPKK